MKKLEFLKMSGVGNDFIIVDARFDEINGKKIALNSSQIQRLSNRKVIGCDQFIIIKNSSQADCFMEIYNIDGSKSSTCGNATRCVAALIMQEKSVDKIIIETFAGLLKCWRADYAVDVGLGSVSDCALGDNISVEMGFPVFEKNHFYFDDLQFFCANIGNPHAVTFVDEIPVDEIFFKIGPEIAIHKFFAQGVNVEFAKIISDDLIEVRVYERGAGETLACGSGACMVAAVAMRNKLINGNKTMIRFKGGDLQIEWQGEGSPIIMTGGYKKIFTGQIDQDFL